MRLPYEYVAFETEKLFSSMPTTEMYDTYLNLLECFGWTRQEFDNEMLKRITLEYNRICGET